MRRLSHPQWNSRLKAMAILIVALLLPTFGSAVANSRQEAKAQEGKPQDPKAQDAKTQESKAQEPKQDEKVDLKHKDEGKLQSKSEKAVDKMFRLQGVILSPAELLVETTILAYGGRGPLQKARATIEEQGTIRLATDQGDISGKYRMRTIRKEKSWQDLLRTDLELSLPESAQKSGAPSSVKYVIAYNGASVWAAQNNQYVSPRTEAEAAFRAQLVHEFPALLRYKEDGSKLELVGPDNVVGLDTNVVELTNPDGQKTRFWISTKTYHILHLEFDLKVGESPTPGKFRVSYYGFRAIQNTLVPGRRKMEQNGKFVQEITITSFSYGPKLEPEVFQHLQES